jgi:ABC-2 type transport system ATP-binding protein
MSAQEFVIDARGLTKHYGRTQALHGLDLGVPAGSIYGLLGRNGAGKTTALKVFMGMVRPSSGEVRVLGRRAGDAGDGVAIRRRTAYVSENRTFWPSMTADQVVQVSRPYFPGWRADLERAYLDAFEIPRRQPLGRLSKGTRTAFAIVLALARGADLMLLDEPTEGLDPVLDERVLQALVRASADDPRLTILFSSHRVAEVEQIADRVGIIADGHLAFEETLDQLRADYRRVTATFDNSPPEALRQAPGVRRSRVEGRMLSLLASRDADGIAAQARVLGARDIQVSPVTLKDIFLDSATRNGH